MTDRDDCIARILKNLRDRKDRKYVEDNLDDLDSRAEADDSTASMGQKYARAAQEMLEEQAIRSAVLKRNLRMDAIKHRDLRTFVDAAPTMRLGIEARLTGVNTQFFDPKSRRGNQDSAAALGLGKQKDWIGGAIMDMRRAGQDDPKFEGLDKLFYSKAIEDAIFIEKAELEDTRGGRPGKTKNVHARKIAEILVKWDKVEIASLNGEGAWITPKARHVASVTHDPDRLRTAGKGGRPIYSGMSDNVIFYKGFTQGDREAWVAETLKHIDAKKMFGSQEPDKALAEMYGGLVTGDHGEITTVSVEPIFGNMARQVSAQRAFVFKSAEDQLAYMRKFGRFEPTDQWLYTKRQAANQFGLMRVFGSKPKEGLAETIAYARNKSMGKPESVEIQKWDGAVPGTGRFWHRYAAISGESDRPIPNMWSGIVNGVMAVQRLSKLGLTPFAMLTDNVSISRELARHGMGAIDRNSSLLSGYFQGADGSVKKEVADLLHTGILGRLRGVSARFDVSDARAGTMAKLENWFFNITGITPMTENKRADAERMMAYHLGKQRDKSYEEMGAPETKMLQSFGIGDKEWALLHKAEWNRIEDEVYLTPDVATKISDADMQTYLGERGTISERAVAAAGEQPVVASAAMSAVERARQDLALKLWSYFSERGQFAVLEVGAREKAILYRGTQAGEPLNIALRLLLQFKQFPTAMLTKTWGSEIYGGTGNMGRMAGVAELIVGSTLLGMVANYLNQTAKGQNPNKQIEERPGQWLLAGFMRGGAATIYGDFLMGEWSRFGLSAAATVLGPSLGQIDRVAELWADITHPELLGGSRKTKATGALATRMVRDNLPFMNMIYTKAAFDYLVYYRLQEWINPGYLQRFERTMKDKNGVEFWLKPSQVSR